MRLTGLLVTTLLLSAPAFASTERVVGSPVGVHVDYGPIPGTANAGKTITIQLGARRRTSVYDVQDGREHNVRGVPLAELLAEARPPKGADTVLFVYTDGMEIPVRLRDKAEIDAIFIALEHGDELNRFRSSFALHRKGEIPCPKVVYTRKVDKYSIWHYPTELASIRLVNGKAYETLLAQPTRKLPDRSGWPLYLQHCASCHGIGGQGAKRGPDFLSNMDTYRIVPPLAVTDKSQHPSLHEKVKGFVEGTMPRLDHVPNDDVATLWRWLHAIYKSATK
jgi:hypothetical protein